MADNNSSNASNANGSVKKLAQEIFVQSAAMNGGRGDRQIAVKALRSAEEFAQAMSDFDSGKLAKPQDAWGADCFAPGMPKMHPVNLISSQRNEETKGKNKEWVNRIAKWLAANPNEEQAYESDEWKWSKEETKTARRLFPAFADSGIFPDKMASAGN